MQRRWEQSEVPQGTRGMMFVLIRVLLCAVMLAGVVRRWTPTSGMSGD